MEDKSHALFCSVQAQLDKICDTPKLNAGTRASINQPV